MKKLLLIAISLLFISSETLSSVQFIVPEISVPAGLVIELPVIIETNQNQIGSLEFALNYDQTKLQFTDILVSEQAQSWLTYTMDTGNGKVRWGGYDSSFGNNLIINPTELFTLTFSVIDQNWSSTPITIGRKTAGSKLGWDLNVTNTDGYINLNRNQWQDLTDGISGTVYPVPTRGTITLDLTIPKGGEYLVRVMDLTGKTIQSSNNRFFQGYVTLQQDLSSLEAGVYLLHISNNRFVKSFRIIKN